MSLRKSLEKGPPPGIRNHKENPVLLFAPVSQNPRAGCHRNRAGSVGVTSQPHPQPCLQQSLEQLVLIVAAVAALPLSFSSMEVVCVEEEGSVYVHQ